VARVVDDRGIDLVAELDAAFQRAAVRIGVGDLVEDQRRRHFELDAALFHTLAENHEFRGGALCQREAVVDGTVAVHQVNQVAAIVQAHAHDRAVVHAANE
jgi:hypothetical protein